LLEHRRTEERTGTEESLPRLFILQDAEGYVNSVEKLPKPIKEEELDWRMKEGLLQLISLYV